MISYLFTPVSSWHLPLFQGQKLEDERRAVSIHSTDWPRPSDSADSPSQNYKLSQETICSREIRQVLSTNDLYLILGIHRSQFIDRLTLRRAYLSRSKACHPDKCPGNPDATPAFQKVSLAYGVLSQPSLKRKYDSRPGGDHSDFLNSHPPGHADETLNGVLLSIVNDFLDGNLEMIRTLLQAISDLNPSLKLSDENIDSVISVLESIRSRMLTCRACILALQNELIRVVELQYAFRRLPYLDIAGRSRLTIQLTRITLSLPVTLEKAIQDSQEETFAGGGTENMDDRNREYDKTALLPRRVVLLIRGIDVILDKMERILG